MRPGFATRARRKPLSDSRAQAIDGVVRSEQVLTEHCGRRKSASGVNQRANHTGVHETDVLARFRTPVHRYDGSTRLGFQNFNAAPSIERCQLVQLA